MILRIDHQHAASRIDGDPFGSVEDCLARRTAVTTVPFLSGSGNMMNRVVLPIDAPNAILLCATRPKSNRRRQLTIAVQTREKTTCLRCRWVASLTCSRDRGDQAGGNFDAAKSAVFCVSHQHISAAIQDDAVRLIKLNGCPALAIARVARFTTAGQRCHDPLFRVDHADHVIACVSDEQIAVAVDAYLVRRVELSFRRRSAVA